MTAGIFVLNEAGGVSIENVFRVLPVLGQPAAVIRAVERAELGLRPVRGGADRRVSGEDSEVNHRVEVYCELPNGETVPAGELRYPPSGQRRFGYPAR